MIDEQPIEQVYNFKYLGLILDDKLPFDQHVDYIHGKSVKKLVIVRKTRSFLDRVTSTLLYKSLVLPYLDNCDIIYSNMGAANLNKLQLLQNGACGTLLLTDRRTSVKEMHNE